MSAPLFPQDEAELSAAIIDAAGPLQILGGGTRTIGRISEGQKLSTAQLKGIVLYEPGALTLVAKTGTSIADIVTALAAENQKLAFEPMDHRIMLGTEERQLWVVLWRQMFLGRGVSKWVLRVILLWVFPLWMARGGFSRMAAG